MAISKLSTLSTSKGIPKSQNFWDGSTLIPVTSGLVMYLDAGQTSSYNGGTWNDISSSGKIITLYGSPSFASLGVSSFLRFNGVSTYAQGDISGVISGLTNASCNIWYRPLSADDNGMLYDHHNYSGAGTRDNFSIRQNWGGANTAGYTTNSDGNFTSVNFENANSYLHTWRNYTQVRRDGTMYAFVNGVQVNSSAITGTIRTSSTLLIGQDAIGTNFLHADFAVMQTFNRGLTNEEVLQNFNFFKGRYGY
jgi:hypothetical protein